MNEQVDRKRIRFYFMPSFGGAVVSFVFGGILLSFALLITVSAGPDVVGVIVALPGLMLVGLGILLLQLSKKKLATGDELERWMSEDIAAIVNKGLEAMSLDPAAENVDPIVVFGPKLSMAKSIGMHVKKGKDDIIRYSPIIVYVYVVLSDYLSVYTCMLNWLTGETHQEGIQRLGYNDIQHVGTKMGKASTWGVRGLGLKSLGAATQFHIVTPGGETHVVVVGSREMETKLGGTLVKAGAAERAIEDLRNRVEARTQSVAGDPPAAL